MDKKSISTIFIDIGNVLLSDGWNRNSRKLAATHFNLQLADFEERHHLTFDTYEVGKITLDQYLQRTVFFEERSFSMQDFKDFMFSQSQPFTEMIELVTRLKKEYGLKVAVISNEGRELTEYRIKKFGLSRFVDFFISSCFVHLRKPDEDIFQLAIDVSQVQVDEIVYIEDRPLFLQVAEQFGIKGIHHIDYQTTVKELEAMGLKIGTEAA